MKKRFTLLLSAVLLLLSSWALAQSTSHQSPSYLYKTYMKERDQSKNQLYDNQQKLQARLNQTLRVPTQATQYTYASGAWVAENTLSYEYNDRGQLTETIYTTVPDDTNEARVTNAYDEQGRDTLITVQEWQNNEWVNYSRSRTKYDNKGNIILQVEFSWSNNVWDPTSGTRHTFSYNENDALTQQVTEVFSSNSWTNSERNVYEYANNSTQPTTITYYNWEAGAWQPLEREAEIVYENQNGQVRSLIAQEWSEETNDWENSTRHNISYSTNASNQATIMQELIEEYENGSWVLAHRVVLEYIEELGEVIQFRIDLNVGEDSWITGFGFENALTFDAQGNIQERIEREYRADLQRFENITRTTYNEFTTITITAAADEILARAINLYPNPVSDNLRIVVDITQIRDATLSIYSLTGQKVYEIASLKENLTIDMHSLPSGIYLVHLTGLDKAVLTKKVVKQ